MLREVREGSSGDGEWDLSALFDLLRRSLVTDSVRMQS
jgi:hypothetical protein